MSVSIKVTVEQGLTAALQQLMEDYPEAVGQSLMHIAAHDGRSCIETLIREECFMLAKAI